MQETVGRRSSRTRVLKMRRVVRRKVLSLPRVTVPEVHDQIHDELESNIHLA